MLILLASSFLVGGCAAPPQNEPTSGAPVPVLPAHEAEPVKLTVQFSVPKASELLPETDWPRDRDSAARDLIEHLPEPLLRQIRDESLSLDQMITEVGPVLARRAGLFHGNEALLESCRLPNTAALGILLAARERAFRGLPPERESWRLRPEDWPLTIEDACAETLAWLPDPERRCLASDSWGRKYFEQALGDVLERRYGLHGEEPRNRNTPLIHALEKSSPLAARPARILVSKIAEKLQEEHPENLSGPSLAAAAGQPPPRLRYSDWVAYEEGDIPPRLPASLEEAVHELIAWEDEGIGPLLLPDADLEEPVGWGEDLARSIAEPIISLLELEEENTALIHEASTPLACIPVILRRVLLLDQNDRLPREPVDPEDDWILGPDTWPLTLEDAARDLIEWIGPENCDKLRDLAEDEMGDLHFGLGMGVRNRMGLWRENNALIEDCMGGLPGYAHPDNASGPIIHRAREILRRE